MKKQKPIITPNIMPRIDVDFEKIDFEHLASKEHRKEFEKTRAYKKYVQPVLDREKSLKANKRKEWWKGNCWDIVNTLIAVAALIISLLK